MKQSKNQSNQKRKDNKNNDEDKKSTKKYSIHLKDPEDLRRLLCEVVNELRKSSDGNLCARASRIIQSAQVLLNIFQQSDFERRLRALEEKEIY